MIPEGYNLDRLGIRKGGIHSKDGGVDPMVMLTKEISTELTTAVKTFSFDCRRPACPGPMLRSRQRADLFFVLLSEIPRHDQGVSVGLATGKRGYTGLSLLLKTVTR